ncbi:MAG TPA: CpsD/CapB family tyrosine-protein kinase [Gaiellaceae bacterium]|nr:CpsD/CapB family tyrosine-protein kinase [Gaiellaceae bacterium]
MTGDSTAQRATAQHGSTLREYLRVVRRRWRLIALALVVVPAAATAVSLREQAMYEATAQVALAQQDLASELSGTPDAAAYTPADRRAQTQADLAREPAVAASAVALAHARLTPDALLRSSSVTVATNADLLTFTVRNHVPSLAARLATAYATAYVRHRLAADTAPIENALRAVRQEIEAADPGSALRASLVGKATQLRTMAALKTANASVVRSAQTATQTAPRTFRNAVLGIVLGLLLGALLAVGYEALDTRVRSSDEIAAGLALPLLAHLPEPPRRLREANRLAMLEEPSGVQAEAFRMLRTNLQFTTLAGDARTIMVTSAVEEEGKSTTIANLAVALARAGKRVTLVELDLRRPLLHRFFDLDPARPGITQVALRDAALDDATTPVPVRAGGPAGHAHVNGNGNGNGGGYAILRVLTAGAIPPDPGEFMTSARLGEILAELRSRSELVLIDAPPLLQVGDGLALSAQVDGVLVVTRIDVLRRGMLGELARLLHTMPARKLGFVVTGARHGGAGYGYGAYYGDAAAAPAAQPPVAEPVGAETE